MSVRLISGRVIAVPPCDTLAELRDAVEQHLQLDWLHGVRFHAAGEGARLAELLDWDVRGDELRALLTGGVQATAGPSARKVGAAMKEAVPNFQRTGPKGILLLTNAMTFAAWCRQYIVKW